MRGVAAVSMEENTVYVHPQSIQSRETLCKNCQDA